MTTEERDKILARVRKCLALANNAGATEAERDTAMRHAHGILAKYNLDIASVESAAASGGTGGAPSEPRVEHVHEFGGWPWARNIAHSIAELCFCDYLIQRGRTDRTTRHFFIGRTSNATTAALMAEYVVKSVFREACKFSRDRFLGNDGIRSFGWGAASRIAERVRELKADVAHVEAEGGSSAPGTALVLASLYDTEAKANKQFIANRYGASLRPTRGGTATKTGSAIAAGRAYGDRVSLNRQVR